MMPGIFHWLLAVDFMPHVYCLRESSLVALHALSDGLIALSYFLIPCVLLSLVRRRGDLPFRWAYVLFGAFILACGTTHVLSIVTLWIPLYRLEGIVKMVTAMASAGTAVMLLRLLPLALAIPSHEQLEHEIAERKRAEAEVVVLNAELENRVRERTIQLEAASAKVAEFADTLDKTQTIIQRLDGTIIYWNTGAASLYGWSREEALGRKTHEMLQTQFPQPLEEIEAALLKSGSWSGEFKQRCRDGSIIWVSSCWNLHRDSAGQPVSVVKVNNNITELKRVGDALRTSEATARSLFENAAQGILTADREGRIVDANAMVAKLFGYSHAELIGASVDMLLPEGLRSRHVGHRAGYTSQPHARTMGQGMDLEARRKDGSEFPVEISLSYVAERQSGGLALAFISDITSRKEASRALLAKNRDLADALAAAREASEHKSSFMANMSHELRTPLNSIIGFTEILCDGKAGDINEIQEEFLGDSLRSARQLLALINDLLDLERIAAGRIDLSRERFDLHQLVREAVHEVSVTPPAVQKRIVLEMDDRVQWVCLDRRKTKQILLNLLMNAVKFTAERGLVTVRVRAAGAERWILEIEDTGIGISEHDQKRLFREFEQLDTAMAKRFPGTGLGLALTKNLVEAQGGTIALSSRVGVGSTFFAILPVTLERRLPLSPSALDESPGALNERPTPLNENPASPPDHGETVAPQLLALARLDTNDTLAPVPAGLPAASVAAIGTAGDEPYVLFLDDDPDIHKMVKLAMRDSGFQLVSCLDGETALRAVERRRPSVSVVDLLMPSLDGFNFISRLLKIPDAGTIPVLVWTNLDLSVRESDGLLLNVRKVIYKRDGGVGRLIEELNRQLRENSIEVVN